MTTIRRNIVFADAGQLRYEIREIVAVGNHLQSLGLNVIWENIGDPIKKGETLPAWIKDIIVDLASRDESYAYVETQGAAATREFLCERVNARGGTRITRNDIVFFNGLGDAVARIFGTMRREARIIGPSPAYPTHSSAEAAHSGYNHFTYELLPDKGWEPDLVNLENRIKYNDSISGILIINPGNPTGAVYSREVLEKMVDIARRYDLMVICDEIYSQIVYNGAEQIFLSQVIGDLPGISLQGISKEYPWPGGRCGWIEVFNQDKHPAFKEYISSIINAKMLEVCSTALPQFSIPLVIGDERYQGHLDRRAGMFEARSNEAYDIFSQVKGVHVIRPRGAFYMSVMFKPGSLTDEQTLPIGDDRIRAYVEAQVEGVPLDKRFVYYLLGATGICVVPLTGFSCEKPGFRITMLETDDAARKKTWQTIAFAIEQYLNS